MSRTAWIPVLAVAAGALSCATGDPLGPGPLAGVWGGPDVVAVFSDSGAAFEFACAFGSVRGAVRVDSVTGFDARGSFTPAAGPIRQDSLGSVPADYRGRVAGDVLSLLVVLPGTADTLGPFRLQRGKGGIVYRCA
jgi:hypothetical protein